MTTQKTSDTHQIFVTWPGFDITATKKMAAYYNAILIRVNPEDFIRSMLMVRLGYQK